VARISVNQNYFRYWGKASPASEQGERFHLLSFHALDVAATGNALIALNQFSLESLATELGWPTNQVE
jgi:CRISPR-associated endonuclease/helicase Cas3